jgi:hypothetical protein
MSILRNLHDTKALNDGDTTGVPTLKEHDIDGIGGDSTRMLTRARDETSNVQNGSLFVCFESTELNGPVYHLGTTLQRLSRVNPIIINEDLI